MISKVKGVVVGICTGQVTISTAEGGPALDFYRRLGWKSTELICLRTYMP